MLPRTEFQPGSPAHPQSAGRHGGRTRALANRPTDSTMPSSPSLPTATTSFVRTAFSWSANPMPDAIGLTLTPGPLMRGLADVSTPSALCSDSRPLPPVASAGFGWSFLDVHRSAPPRLKISINGHETPSPPKAARVTRPFRANRKRALPGISTSLSSPRWLKAGANEIAITTLSGSWALYDCVGLEAPAGTELAEASGTLIGSPRSPPVLVERDGQSAADRSVRAAAFRQGNRGRSPRRGSRTAAR